jgi:hypothetical protein
MKIFLNITILFSCVFSPLVAISQAPNISLAKCYGGSNYEVGQKIRQTNDGGYIFVGNSTSNDGDVTGWHPGYNSGNEPLQDFWVVKVDVNGNIEWQKAIGGSSNDVCSDIIQTSDNGYILTGGSLSINGDFTTSNGEGDLWVVKLNNNGSIDWQKNFGGSASDGGVQVKETSSGDFFVIGLTDSNDGDVSGHHGNSYADVWFIKIDNLGNLIWQKCYGGTNRENWGFFDFTLDGGIIICAETYSNDGDVSGNHGQNDGWLLKIDVTGNIIWQKCLGGSSYEYITSVHSTLDGGYMVTGRSSSNDGDITENNGLADAVAIKTDSDGNIEWQKSYGGSSTENIYHSLISSDGGYILVGETYSNDGDVSGNHGGYDSWVLKISANGLLEWQKCIGGSGDEKINGIIQDLNGSFVTIGQAETNDGDVVGNHSLSFDAWLVKFAATAELNDVSENEISLFPNPVSTHLNISSSDSSKEYFVTDGTGIIMLKGFLKEGINLIEIENLSNGMYFLHIENNSEKVFIKY